MFYYLAIALVILSNVFYQLFQKIIPRDVNPILSLIATYLTAIIVCLIILPFYPREGDLISSVKKLNWTSFALGLAIIGLEIGFLLAYRAGWMISLANIYSTAGVSLILIPLGILLFKESLNLTNTLGVLLCFGGLALLNFK